MTEPALEVAANSPDPRLQRGVRFKSVLDGVPVLLEIDEVVMVDKESQEALLKSHVVEILTEEVS